MSTGPDPSQPDQFDAKVRQIVIAVLSDPLSYPDAMTNWLATYISLNAPAPSVPPPTP